MVSVMRSISCLSLVLCCRKGLCLKKKTDNEWKQEEDGEVGANMEKQVEVKSARTHTHTFQGLEFFNGLRLHYVTL